MHQNATFRTTNYTMLYFKNLTLQKHVQYTVHHRTQQEKKAADSVRTASTATLW